MAEKQRKKKVKAILFSAAQERGARHLDLFTMEISSSATLTLIIKSFAS